MKQAMSMAIAVYLIASGMVAAESQPYAGQETREIASLSAEDQRAILAGEGWGLALPAELNGYPGPLHVLELADDLKLSNDQRAKVEAIYAEMKRDAMAAGQTYVATETHVSKMFQAGHATPERLQAMLSESAAALATLRNVHLAAHLAVTPILTDDQKQAYARLRGYGQGHGGHGAGHGDHSGH